MAMSTSLTTVVSQMNNMREQTGDAVIDVNDLQPDDADQVYYYIDDALESVWLCERKLGFCYPKLNWVWNFK